MHVCVFMYVYVSTHARVHTEGYVHMITYVVQDMSTKF